jgi:hypothetical protein
MGTPSRFSLLLDLLFVLARSRHSIVSSATQEFLLGGVIGVKQAVGHGVSNALPTDRPEFLFV